MHQQSYHLENSREEYIKHSDRSISNKGFNKRLAKEENVAFFTECLNQLMVQFGKKASKHKDRLSDKALKEILRKLDVRDIYFVDGSEITLREVPEGNFLTKVQGERN